MREAALFVACGAWPLAWRGTLPPPSAAQAAPEPKPASAVQAAPEPKPASAAQAAPESNPASAAQAAPEPNPASAAQAAPEPKPASAAQAAPEPNPASAAQTAPEPKPASAAQAAPESNPASAAQAAPEPKPASAAQAESNPASASQAAPEPKPGSARGTIHLSSDPQGADARASFGSSCRTPCSMEVSVDGPFTVTFTRQGFASGTVPVQIGPAQPGVLEAKFAPDPVSIQLAPVAAPEPEAKNKPWKTARNRAARRRAVHHASHGPISRSWKYVDRKRQALQRNLGRLFRGDAFR